MDSNEMAFYILIITWILCILTLKSPLFGIIGMFASIAIFIFIPVLVTDEMVLGLINATLFIGIIDGVISIFLIATKW